MTTKQPYHPQNLPIRKAKLGKVRSLNRQSQS